MAKAKPNSNWTPEERQAFEAAENQKWEVMIPLVESGAVDVDATDKDGNTLLAFAVSRHRTAMVGWLIDQGANVHLGNLQGWEPIHHAAGITHQPIMELLLAAGANPRAKSDHKSEPIHRAGWVSNPMCKLLLDAGAVQTEEDGQGRTLKDIAHQSENDELGTICDYYANLPKLDDAYMGGLTKEKLFSHEENKGGLLDNPETWQRWDEAVATVENLGGTITLEDLLQTNHEGKSWLERAAECRVFPKVLEKLNAQGEHIGADLLLDESGEMTPLMQTITNKGVVGEVFSVINWDDTANNLKQAYAVLPDRARQQVEGWHGLVTQVTRAETRANAIASGERGYGA